jgi:hypothetical protein
MFRSSAAGCRSSATGCCNCASLFRHPILLIRLPSSSVQWHQTMLALMWVSSSVGWPSQRRPSHRRVVLCHPITPPSGILSRLMRRPSQGSPQAASLACSALCILHAPLLLSCVLPPQPWATLFPACQHAASPCALPRASASYAGPTCAHARTHARSPSHPSARDLLPLHAQPLISHDPSRNAGTSYVACLPLPSAHTLFHARANSS